MSKALVSSLLGSLVLAAAVAAPARAAEDKSSPGAYVVLVGVSDYADKQIKPRKNAEADAKALYDLFTDKQYLDTDKDNVKLLLGTKDGKRPSELATKENILKALHWATTKAGKDDLVIFAFFGQGASLGDRICLFGSDSNFKDRAKTAVAAGDIEKELEHLKSERFVGMVDVYFKGFDSGKEGVPEPNPMELYKIFLGDDEKEEHQPLPGRVLFLATNGMKPSLDLPNQGIFAKAMIAGMKGAADNEGYEPAGVVTIDGMLKYLEKELPELARTHGTTKEEKEQLHHVLGGRTNHFALTSNPAVAPQVKARVEKFVKLAKDKKLGSEIEDEGLVLLSRMPKLKARQEMRKTFTKLADGTLTVDAFMKERASILEDMKLKRADAVSFSTKVMQAIGMLRENYVKELSQGELVGWACRGLCKRLDEKKIPAQFKDRLDGCKQLREQELLGLLADIREALGKREDLDKNKDVDFALQTMMIHLDPYTTYIDPETLAEFKRGTDATFTGIGIQIRKDSASDMLLVVSPIKGSPAYKVGLKAGDTITTITREMDSNGKPLNPTEVIPTKGLPLTDAVSKILGKPGTEVKLTVQREGVNKPLEFTIVRGAVMVETVLGHKRKDNDEWDFVIDPQSRIGYIRLTQFAKTSTRDMKKAVAELAANGGLKGLVLDLRFNPGGLLTSAVDISDLFIDDGQIVTIKPRPGAGQEHTFHGERDGSYLGFPMVCLVNGGSASGSEIVSACLQDHKRAVIMGERSYGKGSVQNIMDFKATGGQIKLTTATFWRPSGKNLNKSSTKGTDDEDWGVRPDKGYEVKLSRKDRDDLMEFQRDAEIIPRRDIPAKEPKQFKDRQLESALEYLRGQIKMASKTEPKKAG
ncbi:MAG: caspase family protein [Gemmataceae bacterium]|nr:caspase family protein [Gemmataceae bacterium]